MVAETTVPTPSQAQQNQSPTQQTRAEETYVLPAVDIYEDDRGLVLLADLPGVDPANLDVRLDKGKLAIQARASHVTDKQAIYSEFHLTGFFREFQIMEEIDSNNVTAEMHNGVLTLRLPRAPEAQPRRIEVRPS